MAATRPGVKDRIVHEIGRAIKQAQLEWCGVGCVRACTGRWLVLSLDAALLHGLHSLNRGYWPVVAALLDKQSLATITMLPYATKSLSKGRSWVCLCLNDGQLESYLHVLTSHRAMLEAHYGSQALLRDPHRAHLLLMLAAGLEHLRFAIPMDVPGWIQDEGSVGNSSSTSVNSLTVSMTSMCSSLPSPSQQDTLDVDTTCSEAMEESWHSIERDEPVSLARCDDMDTAIEIEHIPKVSRKKRGSRSSSRSSSQVSSGGTTPVESDVQTTTKAAVKDQLFVCAASCDQRVSGENLGTIPFDSRTGVFHGEKIPKKTCDNFDKDVYNISKDKKSVENNIRCKENQLREDGRDTCLHKQISRCVETKDSDSKVTKQEKGSAENESVVIHRRQLPASKNSEKRVSFTDMTDAGHTKHIHNRLSLGGDRSTGTEIRDLNDLRDLLSNLRDQGLLPVSLALDELFNSLDQSSPALSERAPPEGQEDPPLHQSIISLAPNINNNNSVNDDSNNNNHSDENRSRDVGNDATETEEGTKDQTQGEKQIGCFSQQNGIIDGVRWEELTMIGQKMLEEGSVEGKDIDARLLTLHRNQGNVGNQDHLVTGTRPKQRLGAVLKTEPQNCQTVNDSDRVPRRERKSCRKCPNQEERKWLYNHSYRTDRQLPSLYIPLKVDSSKFKEEEDRLALEVAQGQSNMTVPGHIADPITEQRISAQLFTGADEKLYRVFNVREGHSSGSSVGVQVVLSSQALYVVTPRLRGAKQRHAVFYHDIHTIIVGANDQWICILSKEAVRDDLETAGTKVGIQLEVGDPEITHNLVNCLEVAIRRHFAALKVHTKERYVKSCSDKRSYYPARKEFLQEFTKECVDNFSNSLLEESLLNAWDTRKNSAISQATDISQDSPVATPGSGHISQDSAEGSQESTDVSDVSNDISPASTEVSQTSVDGSQVSSDLSQVSSEVSNVSTDATHESVHASHESVDTSQATSDMSRSLSDDTPTSSDMIQSLSNVSQESLDGGHIPVGGSEDTSDTSQVSGDTVTDSKTTDYVCPLQLHIQKQDIFYRYAGGYSRWNGTLLERSLPGVVAHPAWELAGLRKWLRAQLRIKEYPKVIGYWLVDWEDGSSLGGGDAVSGPLGPANEGPLMFKPPGILMPWRPAYFILKAGVLYQFNDARERLPHLIVEVVQCVGCVRIASSQRPHAFQLLRKKDAPLTLAASDEHQASLWLQAFLTIINSGVRDISERTQVPCRVILLESGVLLAQQSDLIIGPPSETTLQNGYDDKSSAVQRSQQMLGTSPVTSAIQGQSELEKKDFEKPLNLTVANLRDRKPLSSSLTSLNRVGSSPCLLGSPRKCIGPGERSSTPIPNILQRKSSLCRLSDCGIPDIKLDVENVDEKRLSSPQKKLKPRRMHKVELTATETSCLKDGFNPKGEVKVLTFSTLEHLSSVSIYAECPTTCLMEFECSEAGEISGDWALYFRSGSQLQEFITTLTCTWRSLSEHDFPLHTVDNAGVQQFLLEGSQISSNGWSCLHL
ncbi:serine-rich adhesin for platelets isoform X1 [Procambarus clarkii]|uniref:serine-rich adhesin for platelets isoform X1 n=2 Tax=Procambarus clarkii TaxID=6728 RepID=UPI0037425486